MMMKLAHLLRLLVILFCMNAHSSHDSGAFTLQDSPKVIKNFYDTFGYIKIKNFFSPQEIKMISEHFNILMQKKFGKVIPGKSQSMVQIIEYDEFLTSLLDLKKLNNLMTALLGEDFIYYGSDGHHLASTANWHRDWLLKTRVCKMNIYLEKTDANTGALRVIPGSHFIDDAFSSFLSNALQWPDGPYEGGFDEKGFFGKGNNPNNKESNKIIPHAVIPTNPGDIIIFNNNLVHCTSAPSVPKNRRLLALHFMAHPKHTSNPAAIEKEIKELTMIDFQEYRLKNKYGPYVMNSKSKNIKKMTHALIKMKNSSNQPEHPNLLSRQVLKTTIDYFKRKRSNTFKSKRFEN